jgi:Phasin protein
MVNRNPASRGADANVPMPHPFDVTAVIEASRPTLSAAAEMNGRLYETVAAFNTEYIGFVNRRLKEDLGMPQQLASCRTVEDVYGVYTGFFQRAVEQYQAEFEQLAKLSQTMASDTVNQVQEQAGKIRREMR